MLGSYLVPMLANFKFLFSKSYKIFYEFDFGFLVRKQATWFFFAVRHLSQDIWETPNEL